jgi:two-component system, cell cycle sensor histidine kinase and response regulator CckA
MKQTRSDFKTPWILWGIFLFLVIGILIMGSIFFTKQQERIKTDAQNNLSAIADLKVEQILQWKQERLNDAFVLFDNHSFSSVVGEYFNTKNQGTSKEQILSILESHQKHYGYESVFLLDRNGIVCLSPPSQKKAIGQHGRALVQDVLLQRKVIFSDLHTTEYASFVHIDLAGPIIRTAGKDSTVIGIFFFRIDPNTVLFPLIQKWPTPSRTSETLLLEKNGDSIVYLNELRHRKHTTLTLRLPISNEQLPASMAVRGTEGTVEGIDYRGIPVLAAIRHIPNSPWYINAKVDQEEIYADLRLQTRINVVGLLIFIAALGGIFGVWWHWQRAQFYRERYADELERQALIAHLDYAIKYANDMIILINRDGRIVDANEKACTTYGYTREELSRLTIHDLRSPGTRSHVDTQLKQVEELGGLVFETEHIQKDGTVFPVEVSSRFIKIEGSQFYQSIIRDITERKRAEEALRKSEAMLSESQRVASIGHYVLDTKTGFWTCSKALETIFGIDETYSKNVEGWKSLIHPDHKDEMLTYLQEHVLRGKNSFNKEYKIIRIKDKAVRWMHGLGNLESDDQGNTIKMFGTIQDITEWKQAEDARQQEHNLLQTLIDTLPDNIFVKDTESRIVLDNMAHQNRLGANSQQETAGKTDFDFFPKELAASYYADEQEIIQSGKLFLDYEEKTVSPDGSPKWLLTTKVPLKDKEGKIIGIVGINHDITSRKHTEKTLQEIHETLNTLFEAAPLPIFALDLDGHVQNVWNPAAEKLLGWKKEEVIGKYLPSITPEKEEEFRNFRERIRSGQSLDGVQVVRKKKDGSLIEYAIYATPLHNHEGEITGNIVLLVDLTERRRTEEAIRQTESLFKILVESSPVAITVFSGPSKKLKYVSKRFSEIFGYDQKDIPTLNMWWPLAYPVEQYRDQIQTKWCEIVEKDIHETSEIEPLESVVTCQDGSTKYIESTFLSIGEDTLVFFIDLTQHRLAQEALRQTHSFNELLIQTMPFGMDIVDEEGTILFMSKIMRDMVGSEATNTCCWTAYRDDKQQCAHCPLRNGIHFGKPETIESTGVFGGKTYQISHVGMMYEGKKAILEVFQDITEQKKLQQELIQSQKLLSIGTMAGGIAHDFNNILAIILGYSSILHSIKDNSEKFTNGVTAIRQAVDRGAGLVRQILTFARKTDTSFEPLSISDLVLELISMLQQTFPKIITFNTHIEKHLPYIQADHTQMHQALLNLCVNARDAMPQGGEISIVITKIAGETIKDRFPQADNLWYVSLNVSDTGMGMNEFTRSQIFDPFFTTKEKGKGTGLGLSVVYGIIQAHHGFVHVDSTPEQGTTFRLYFPVPQETKAAQETHDQTTEQISGGNETLLFVEDEPLLLDMVQILLESNGYIVYTAKDGEEAVQVYQEHSSEIALVISDMGLPKLTGISEFEKMKEINPSMKIIFASGYFEPNMKTTLEQAGVKAFLQKPYVIEDILSKIRKTLDSH